jgi:tetratricopeptide (TPR) repeat protein
VKSRLPLASFCVVLFFISCAIGQTYQINGTSSSQNSDQKQKGANTSQDKSNQSGLGWGSNIEVDRQVHAAEDALSRKDYAAAVSFAERAAQSAPQDPELWFMLGYCARMADRYGVSVDAYNRGLKLKPSSVNGLAGLAQTYAKMGRTAESEKLLQRVIDANPKDANSLQLAGELMLNSDPKKALDFLQQADRIEDAAHTDLLIAHAYERLNQPEDVARYLDRAQKRAPNDPEVLRAIAGQYRDEGQFDKAIASLQAIPKPNTDTLAELAYTYEVAGRPQEAADLYTRLARSAKGNIGLDLSAAQSLVSLGQNDAAEPFLEDARRINADSYRLHAILGSVAESENRLDDATAEYNLALKNLGPSVQEGPLYPVEIRLNLYELDVRENNDADAKQQLAAGMALLNQAQVPDSSKPEMLRLRAAIEAGEGNTDAANKDLQEALALAPNNVNSLMNFASLQWKIGQKDAAVATFEKVLQIDPTNRGALSSLGYLARDKGDQGLAESYFTRAIKAHPNDFEPYLALGDLYGAERKFSLAETNYEDAYKHMPTNPMIVAGGANAALEAHNLDLAKRWLDRAKGKMKENPQVEREGERYFTWKGDYGEAAKLGQDVLSKLPHDREGVDYLAYDLYYLGRYDDALALVTKYDSIVPNDKDLALIAGEVHAHNGDREQAVKDFSVALQRDPTMPLGYVNRGFMLNDLHQAAKAIPDFREAARLDPRYTEAHLGLAYADLQLHRPHSALVQLEIVQKQTGKSHALHLAKAEAYRQEQAYPHAESEYRIALDEDPKDVTTQLAYADVLFRLRRYQRSLATLAIAEKLDATDPHAYALQAQIHAKLKQRDAAMHDVQLAEQYGGNDVDILMSTGGALLALGDRDGAMERFARALDVPNGDRVGVRLAIAQVFMAQGHYDEARRQIALGFAESRMDKSSITAEDIQQAAGLFLAMHDYDLAETYFDKAKLAGGNPRVVGVGLANTYLSEGETQKASNALTSLGPASEYADDYDYQMALANVYRQRQDPVHALSSFVQAGIVAAQDDQQTAELEQDQVALEEGRQLNDKFSFLPEAAFVPALEDINVYTLDSRILHVTNPALLPPPRKNFQDTAGSHYRLHIGGLPLISGFIGESLTTGRLLYPSVGVVQDRNTYDTIFNGGLVPILRFGRNSISFNGGLQFTVRRDTISPVFMSQNLFRQFLYISTSSFHNWVSINANGIRETGPFIDQNLHSREADGTVEFTVGRPWGSTSLLTGYSARDLLFRPFIEEYFDTTSYIGLQHKFGNRFTAAALAEDLRSWRVQSTEYAIAQALLPGGRFDFRVNPRWDVQGSFVLSRGLGFHEYDNAQSQFLVTYTRPMGGLSKDGTPVARNSYPFRLSVGMQQQTFYDFSGGTRNTFLPVVQFNLF